MAEGTKVSSPLERRHRSLFCGGRGYGCFEGVSECHEIAPSEGGGLVRGRSRLSQDLFDSVPFSGGRKKELVFGGQQKWGGLLKSVPFDSGREKKGLG